MATYTPNYNLYKPAGTDQFDNFLTEFGNNMDIIDSNLGGGGGSSTLAGLSDVNLTSPITNDALIYDGAEWVNSPLASVALSGDYNDLLNKPTIPTKVSDLTNDSGFITNTVNNLTNYYLKSETYTQAEVNALIAGIVTLNVLVVQSLPTTNISTTTIYLVPKTTAGTQDVYDEYLNLDGTTSGWEHIGTTEIDLSNYYTKTQVDTLLADKVDKVSGKGLSTEDYTTAEKNKLAGIASGAEVNVQSDWNQSNNAQDDYIKNKPTKLSDFTNDSGFITGVEVSDIGDVDLNNLANGQVLKYNSTSQKWENQNESGGGGSYTEGDGIDITNNAISVDTTFTEASTRTNIASGDTFSTILGKIKKWFTDLPSMFVSKTGDTMTGRLTLTPSSTGTVLESYRTHTDTSSKATDILLGNNIANGTAGSCYGRVTLYGKGANYTVISAPSSTANRAVDFPDASGTVALKSDIPDISTKVSKSGDTMTGALTINRAADIQAVFSRNHTGTSSAITSIDVGNNVADGTAGSTYGRIRLFGKRAYRTNITASASTANRDIEFPDKSGTLLCSSDISVDTYASTTTYLEQAIYDLHKTLSNNQKCSRLMTWSGNTYHIIGYRESLSKGRYIINQDLDDYFDVYRVDGNTMYTTQFTGSVAHRTVT